MPSLKIKIKRRTLQGKFTPLFRDLFPSPNKKKYVSRNFGILTACGRDHFIGLQMLISSVAYSYDIIILVYDIGMTQDQISWCHRQPGVTVKPYKLPEYQKHIGYPGAWFKSHYISSSPFKHTIWIDADTMVIGDLYELIDWAHPQALFTADHTPLRASTINSPTLYSYMPIGKSYYHDILPYLNSGVTLTHKKRDEVILKDWRYCVEQACLRKEIADVVSCWDQGALKWSLHKNEKLYLIVPDKKFNYPASVRHYSYPALAEGVHHWMNNIKPKEPCVILHWMGGPKPWKNWGEILDLDLSTN